MLCKKQLKRVVVSCLFAVGMTSACAKAEPSDSKAFIDWTSENLIAVDRLDGSLSGTGLESFKAAIGSARVVGVGESRHDTREQLLFKGLLVRHLIKDLGFRALILEESFPHAQAIDHYVMSGEGDLRAIMNGVAGWYLWDTEEMLELVEWIRQFNKGCKPSQMVRIFGMDITAPALGVRRVMKSLNAAGVDRRLSARTLGLDLQRGDYWPGTWERYGAASVERRRKLAGAYRELVATLEAERTRLISSFSEKEYERTLLLAEIGQMGNELFSSADRARGGAMRESGMYAVVQWLLDREIPDDRAIVWAHNLHVAKSSFRMPGLAEGDLKPMGVLLSEALGDSYVAIGGAFGAGSYKSDLPPGGRVFKAAAKDVMDGALDRVGVPHFLVDLRSVEEHSGAARWLQQERGWEAQDAQAVLVPGASFDLVYFVKRISRAQPTRMALRRFQKLGK